MTSQCPALYLTFLIIPKHHVLTPSFNTLNSSCPWALQLSLYPPIQTIPYNSLFVARQNAPVTSIDTNVILSSWIEFDAGLLFIGQEEMIWFLCFAPALFTHPEYKFYDHCHFAVHHPALTLFMSSPAILFQCSPSSTLELPYPWASWPYPSTLHHPVLTLSRSSPTIPFQFPPSRAPYLPSRTVWNWYSILAFSAISAIRSGMKPVYLVPSFFAYGSSCSKVANLKFHSNKFWIKNFHRLPDRENSLQGVFLSNGGLFYSKITCIVVTFIFWPGNRKEKTYCYYFMKNCILDDCII